MQVITLGSPSTRARQPSHAPRMHDGPRGLWNFELRATDSLPVARRAAATGSPFEAKTAAPSKVSRTGSSVPRARKGIFLVDPRETVPGDTHHSAREKRRTTVAPF